MLWIGELAFVPAALQAQSLDLCLQLSTMQATRGKTTHVSQDIEQQNMTVPAKRRTGLSADIAEVRTPSIFPTCSQLSYCLRFLYCQV